MIDELSRLIADLDDRKKFRGRKIISRAEL